MIEGFFDKRGQLFFEIELIANDGEIVIVDALLDTGFTDYLTMNVQDVDSLGWRKSPYTREMETARGEVTFSIYEGAIKIDEQTFNILTLVGEGISQVILGLLWLRTRRLIVDYPNGVLTLG